MVFTGVGIARIVYCRDWTGEFGGEAIPVEGAGDWITIELNKLFPHDHLLHNLLRMHP